MRKLYFVKFALIGAGLILSACGQDEGVDEKEFFSNLVVPVSSDFTQEDAKTILGQCNAAASSITLLEGGRAQFKPADGTSVDTSACVLDQLMRSGRPRGEVPAFEPTKNIGPEPKAS